jgi:hypothetical protein
MGMLVFGMALISYISATFASRVGARYASLHSLSSDTPCTSAAITAIVQAQLYLPNASAPTIMVFYGNRADGVNGNYVGDLVGIVVIWSQTIQIPFYGSKTFYISNQAYRFITR